MASLDEAFTTITEHQNKSISDEIKCPKCKSKVYDITDDGNRTCSCAGCGYIHWKHGKTSICKCFVCNGTWTEDDVDID